MKLIVRPEVKEWGIGAVMALIKGASVSNKSNPLEKLKKATVERLAEIEAATGPVLAGYRRLYERAAVSGEGILPPAAHLLALAGRNGRLPNINTVVDCYNLVSLETGLSIGAHDLAHLRGDLQFRLTDGSELYVPLGATEPTPVGAGEYAATDDEKIICRLDVKQCDQTKVTKGTAAFILYVQGNAATPADYLQSGLDRACRLITQICGGSFEFIPESSLSG